MELLSILSTVSDEVLQQEIVRRRELQRLTIAYLGISVDAVNKEIHYNGKIADLNSVEWNIFACLLQSRVSYCSGRVLHNASKCASLNAMEVGVSSLRFKLKRIGLRIAHKRNVGYRLTA